MLKVKYISALKINIVKYYKVLLTIYLNLFSKSVNFVELIFSQVTQKIIVLRILASPQRAIQKQISKIKFTLKKLKRLLIFKYCKNKILNIVFLIKYLSKVKF